jgi:hypothetical protein
VVAAAERAENLSSVARVCVCVCVEHAIYILQQTSGNFNFLIYLISTSLSLPLAPDSAHFSVDIALCMVSFTRKNAPLLLSHCTTQRVFSVVQKMMNFSFLHASVCVCVLESTIITSQLKLPAFAFLQTHRKQQIMLAVEFY